MIAMKKVIKLMKAFWFMDTSVFKWLFPISIILAGLISLLSCSLGILKLFDYLGEGTSINFFNYANGRQLIFFDSFFIQILNLINLSYILIYTVKGLIMWKGQVSGNLNNFLLQAPVLKKDIILGKFCIFHLAGIPFLFSLLYLIGMNLFVSTGEFMSAYTGFLILIYCLWALTLSLSIGSSYLSSKIYNAFKYLFIALFTFSVEALTHIHEIPFIPQGIEATTEEMVEIFGKSSQDLIITCRYISGVPGLILLLCSISLSYYLGCRLPLKLSEKRGD